MLQPLSPCTGVRQTSLKRLSGWLISKSWTRANQKSLRPLPRSSTSRASLIRFSCSLSPVSGSFLFRVDLKYGKIYLEVYTKVHQISRKLNTAKLNSLVSRNLLPQQKSKTNSLAKSYFPNTWQRIKSRAQLKPPTLRSGDLPAVLSQAVKIKKALIELGQGLI